MHTLKYVCRADLFHWTQPKLRMSPLHSPLFQSQPTPRALLSWSEINSYIRYLIPDYFTYHINDNTSDYIQNYIQNCVRITSLIALHITSFIAFISHPWLHNISQPRLYFLHVTSIIILVHIYDYIIHHVCNNITYESYCISFSINRDIQTLHWLLIELYLYDGGQLYDWWKPTAIRRARQTFPWRAGEDCSENWTCNSLFCFPISVILR